MKHRLSHFMKADMLPASLTRWKSRLTRSCVDMFHCRPSAIVAQQNVAQLRGIRGKATSEEVNE